MGANPSVGASRFGTGVTAVGLGVGILLATCLSGAAGAAEDPANPHTDSAPPKSDGLGLQSDALRLQSDGLGPSADRVAPGAGFRFGKTRSDGEPVRWDPCGRPIAVVLSGRRWGSPDGAAVKYAVARVAEATGLRFRLARKARRTPVGLQQWKPERSSGKIRISVFPDGLGASGAVGLGTWFASGSGRYERLTAGLVQVDATVTAQAPPWIRALVYMHEIGHVIGLGHVPDPDQVMNASLPPPAQWSGPPPTQWSGPPPAQEAGAPVGQGVRSGVMPGWGSGDLLGLQGLGAQGGCLPQPVPIVKKLRLRGMSALRGADGRIEAKWVRAKDARHYLVKTVSRDRPGRWQRVSATRLTLEFLPPGRYRIKVRAVGASGAGPVVQADIRL